MRTIEITTDLADPIYAYPASQKDHGDFANWLTKRRPFTGSSALKTATVDTSLDGPIWYIFVGNDPPTSWDQWLWFMDFTTIIAVEDATADIPKFGQTQRWTNPTETLDVTITEAP